VKFEATFLTCVSIILVVCLVGCRADQQNISTSASAFKTYKLRGKVVSTDAAKSEVTLDHEEIKDFMGAMTMPYKLKDPTILSELHPGDTVTADVLVSDQDVLVDHFVVVAQAKPDYKPGVLYHVPKAGDEVPDFVLLNQSNEKIHLGQFRGKALLLTFIYTRCPLADFCPRMSKNFAKIDKTLLNEPSLLNKTHLLSVSFDQEYDTPAVLRSYGGAYTEKYTNEKFEHWDFAAPAKSDLTDMEKFFDIGAVPETNSSITHSLSTVLIGPDGKIVNWYPGNEWKPEEVLGDIRKVLAKAS
jgi:protein SCO1/2